MNNCIYYPLQSHFTCRKTEMWLAQVTIANWCQGRKKNWPYKTSSAMLSRGRTAHFPTWCCVCSKCPWVVVCEAQEGDWEWEWDQVETPVFSGTASSCTGLVQRKQQSGTSPQRASWGLPLPFLSSMAGEGPNLDLKSSLLLLGDL